MDRNRLMWAINTILTTRVYMNLVWLAKKPHLTVVSGTESESTTIGLHVLKARPRMSTFGVGSEGDEIYAQKTKPSSEMTDQEENAQNPSTAFSSYHNTSTDVEGLRSTLDTSSANTSKSPV